MGENHIFLLNRMQGSFKKGQGMWVRSGVWMEAERRSGTLSFPGSSLVKSDLKFCFQDSGMTLISPILTYHISASFPAPSFVAPPLYCSWQVIICRWRKFVDIKMGYFNKDRILSVRLSSHSCVFQIYHTALDL